MKQAKGTWTEKEARHLLSRAGFGGAPEDVARLHAMGREGAVGHLLNPTEEIDAFPMPDWADRESVIASMKDQFARRQEVMRETAGMTPEQADKKRREQLRDLQRDSRQKALESQGWWFKRIYQSDAPLREKMTLFWHDHFATSFQKVRRPALLLMQNALFREHAMGNFRTLTQAIVRDPAMMDYLDIQKSSKAMPNENFAREVMELFTLGEGNYSEQDIREAARAFTGYTINRMDGSVMQSERQWDSGDKTIFGKTGRFNGTDVVNLIFKRPECATFMAGKLWEYFVNDSPPEGVVASLGKTLAENNHEIAPVLREIFLSEEFYSERALGVQIKCPVQYLVQMLKELEVADPPMGFPLIGQTQLGQVLFAPPNVAGWDWGKAWINTNTLLTRYNLAGQLIKGGAMSFDGRMGGMIARRMGGGDTGSKVGFTAIATEAERNDTTALVDGLIARFFGVPVPDKLRSSFIAYADSKKGVSFTDKELGELCHLMLSTPHYQLC
ncbi:MAG: DUF1800 domain-containing protein [Luteolibacter sp.]